MIVKPKDRNWFQLYTCVGVFNIFTPLKNEPTDPQAEKEEENQSERMPNFPWNIFILMPPVIFQSN